MKFSRPSTRRLLGVAAAAVATALALTSCSSGGGAQQSADAKQTITWWSWNPDNHSDAQWITAFEKDHPNITVKHRFIQYSDYVNAVRLAATTSSGPDVFGLQVGALTNQFAPLTVDLAPLAAKGIGADWKNKLNASEQLVADGKQVGLPWMVTGGGLIWYNKGLLAKAGVSAPPTTLDEWLVDCKKVTAIGKTCFVQGAKDDWINLDMYQSIVNELAPAAFYDAIKGTGSVKFDSADFVKAFDVWKSLFSNGIMQKGALAQTQYPDANDAFHKGNAAFILNGTWQDGDMSKANLATQAQTYGDAVKSEVFLPAAFPDVVGGAKETGRLFGGPDVGWAISAKSSHQAAAFTFVQWLTASTTAQTIMGKSLAGQPALKSVPVDDSDVVNDAGKAALASQASQLSNLIGARQIPSADVQSALGQALSSVASGQMTSAAAANSVQAAIDSAK
ncbi:ABC transporter substrate-binding protein [Amnibacterium sp.]|uniref:ABC transporter substrate-binding protein n=1 Tax=Amnibacterium sp. TaxID=1872496 RepID=UPI003F7C33D7